MAQPSSLPPVPSTVRLRHRLVAILWSLSGGLFAIFGALVKETGVGGGPLLVMLFAPAIEEVLKPCGVYFLLERRVRYLSSRLQVALLSMMGGIVFAAIENVIYLCLYVRRPVLGLIVWRWTVCLAMHAACSFLVGLGLGKLLPAMRRGEPFELEDCFGWVIAAIVIHGVYNASVTFITTFGGRLY